MNRIINLLLLIAVQFFFPSYGLAQDITTENKIFELIKRSKIEKEIKSGIKDFYIGKNLFDPTAPKLFQGPGGVCEPERDFNTYPSDYASTYGLNQDSFKKLGKFYNQVHCKINVFEKEN